MIVDPDFCDHWKTRMLVGTLDGDECAPLYVLRLWAHCQNRRQSTFENISPEALKALCRFPGNANKLESSLVTSGFVRRDEKVLVVVGWDEYNSSLIAAWNNGTKGGRPPKFKPKTNPDETQTKPMGLPVGKPLGRNPGVCDKIRVDEIGIKEREVANENRIPFLETRSTKFLNAWDRWKRHSQDNGKPIGAMSEETQLKSLFEAYPNETEAINAIEFSMKNNWRNIDLKNSHNRKDEKPQPKSKSTNNQKLNAIFEEVYGT